MALEGDIKEIDLRRLAILEQQRAYAGVDCDPKILLEIADLRQKYGAEATAISRDAHPLQENREPRTIRDLWNEVDFLRSLISATLTRINTDAGNRTTHQRLYMAWMTLISIALIYALFIR
jgi:hypothetical protein